jgi:thiol-disulfide isomerase/thioredoxin
MKSTKIKVFFLIIIILILGVIISVASKSASQNTSGKYDAFAACLKNSGATFYGAFWCPHCQAEKKLFGSSEQFLLYVECSTPDGSKQTQVCIDKKIMGYPTWEFADGTRINGEASLEMLAQKTSCVLPQ